MSKKKRRLGGVPSFVKTSTTEKELETKTTLATNFSPLRAFSISTFQSYLEARELPFDMKSVAFKEMEIERKRKRKMNFAFEKERDERDLRRLLLSAALRSAATSAAPRLAAPEPLPPRSLEQTPSTA